MDDCDVISLPLGGIVNITNLNTPLLIQSDTHMLTHNSYRIFALPAVADLGEGSGGPRPLLFLDQTEARRAKKKIFFETISPLSEDLDLPLACLSSRKAIRFLSHNDSQGAVR